jgi:hypothetical protein
MASELSALNNKLQPRILFAPFTASLSAFALKYFSYNAGTK